MNRIFSTAGASGLRAFALASFGLVLAPLLVSCTANGNPAEPQPGAAEPYVRMLDGIQVADLAITEYRVSARYLAPAAEPIDLLIRVRDTGEFGPDAAADFEDDGYGSLLMELQVRLP